MSQLNPSTELFAAVLARLLKVFPDRVFSTVMPPEGTPYPFIYISAAHEIEDFRMKGAWFGQAGLSINVWHNDPSQRGTVDSLLFSIRQICRGLEQTENYSWCLSSCSLEYLPDRTTDQPLYRGILSLEFKHYRRNNE